MATDTTGPLLDPDRHADLNERVATRDDYHRLKDILPLIRNKGDANPAMVGPHTPTKLQYGHHCDCLTNTARYIEQHPTAKPVKCFRIWIAPPGASNGGLVVSAQAHLIPLHNGKYVEVTPPEVGDEGKNFMIVPTSRAYPEYSAERLVELHHKQRLRLALGGVFHPYSWLQYQQSLRGSQRAQGDAGLLVAYARPYVYDLPTYVPRQLFFELAEDKDRRGRVLFRLDTLLQLIDAKRWNDEDKSAGSGQEVE